jgi:hypothetical protein
MGGFGSVKSTPSALKTIFFGPVTTIELNGKTGTGASLFPVSSLHTGFSVKGEGFAVFPEL